MLQTEAISRFVSSARFEDVPVESIDQLKRHLLDSIGSLIFSLDKPAIQKLALQIKSIGEGGHCKTPVLGNIAEDRAAQFYTALIRYPDFMDNFLGKEATCHPSDNIGALLAASQISKASGKDFLLAMALGYEIECRLVQEIPVMIKGFDHTTLLSYSVTAALSKLLGLSEEQTMNALAIAGCSFNPLVTSRAAYTYEWKGFASSLIALSAMNIALLAKENMTGPIALFEGPKSFKAIMDMELTYDWQKENFELIKKCVLKSYNAEVHTQSAIEAVLELKDRHLFIAEDIETIDVTTFLTCYHIVGGGMYGDRTEVHSKEQADHSLAYIIAVAVLDGNVWPAQLLPERIVQNDVQQLLKKVKVHTLFPVKKPVKLIGLIDPYTAVYPEKVPAKVTVVLKNKKEVTMKVKDFKGFFTRPFCWLDTENKFRKLTSDMITDELQQSIIDLIKTLENRQMHELFDLLNTIEIKN